MNILCLYPMIIFSHYNYTTHKHKHVCDYTVLIILSVGSRITVFDTSLD